MANYTPYIPAVGSITYATQIENFIILSEAIDTEFEAARNGEATLLDSINLKLSLTGGTLSGDLILELNDPELKFINTSGGVPANESRSSLIDSAGVFRLDFVNDAETSSNTIISIDKSGTNASSIELTPTTANGVTIIGQTVWNAGNDGIGSTLDADLLDGIEGAAYARLDLASTFTTIPAFNGGISGVSVPFTVDSTQLIPSLNADLLDGIQGAAYARLDLASTFTTIPIFNGGTSGASAPFTVDSTQVVTNLNADLLDGQQGTYYAALTSPTFTGTPSLPTGTTGVTQTVADNSTKLSTTAYADASSAAAIATLSGDFDRSYTGYGNSTTDLTVSSSTTWASGEYVYRDLTIDASVILTPTDTVNGTLIIRGDTLILNGEISADGRGAAGAIDPGGSNHVGTAGTAGFLGGGGGAGSWADYLGGAGGAANYNIGGVPAGIGTSGSGGALHANAGTLGIVQMAMNLVYSDGLYTSSAGSFRVKAGGGGGSGGDTNGAPGDGANGGGIIILIFRTVILGASSVVSADGNAGQAGASDGAGGGGGGGVAIIITENLTDSGITNTAIGGTGGTGTSPTGLGGAGGTGYAGILEI